MAKKINESEAFAAVRAAEIELGKVDSKLCEASAILRLMYFSNELDHHQLQDELTTSAGVVLGLVNEARDIVGDGHD